jgi:hypothetical protein
MKRKILTKIFQNLALGSALKIDHLNILGDKNAPRSDISVPCTTVGDEVHLMFLPWDSKTKESSNITSTKQAQRQKMLLACEHKEFMYSTG